jgi:hypothetical protein
MKKYVVLSGDWYYPMAGLRDLVGGFDTIEEAQNKENLKHKYEDGSVGVHDWGYIVDRDSWEILYSWEPDTNRLTKEQRLAVEWQKVEDKK